MSNVNRRSVFVFASTLLASLTLISLPVRAVTTSFDQISWASDAGGYEDQNSQWGEANVSFSAADVASLTPFGSGYMGWVNVVTAVGGGSNNNWAVMNEPVLFSSASEVGGDLPFSFKFDLGQTDGTAVSSLNYSLTLSTTPLGSEPGGPLSLGAVATDTELEGDQTDSLSEGDEAAGQARDSAGAGTINGLASSLAGRGTIATATTNVPVVTEQANGCAPGAAARSIRYLGNMFPSLNVTQSAQQIYGTLTNLMKSDTGPNSTKGTAITNFVSGKNLYFATNNLQIAPTVVTTVFSNAINSLNSTGDVELGVFWGFRYVTNGVTGQISTNSMGGHAVFVTGITTLTTNGVPYRYIVDVIQDPNQGGGSLTNGTDRYTFDTSGNMLNRGGAGAGINSFRIETVVPEPATVELAALGLGAIGFSLARRKRRRKRS